jgi:hypothetical protein
VLYLIDWTLIEPQPLQDQLLISILIELLPHVDLHIEIMMRQNTNRVLAPSKLAAQASQKYLNGVQRSNALPRGVSFNKGSSASYVASGNSTATGKLAAKTLVMPSSSQVSARTSKTAQVISPPKKMSIHL